MTKRPPKPRLPSRTRATLTAKTSDTSTKGRKRGRVTIAEIADRIDDIELIIRRIDTALSPQTRSKGVAAEEHALLNLVDSIVDRRTEQVLLPLAHLATILDRLVACPDPADQGDLVRESKVQLDLVLQSLGLERIAPNRGDESDPWLHEEVDVNPNSALEEGLVERLVRPGIRVRGGKTLVPALIVVSGRLD